MKIERKEAIWPDFKYMYIPSPFLGNREFKMLQQQHQWEYPQSNNMFNKQNNNFAHAEHFFVHFQAVTAWLHVRGEIA